jgi:LDH2 family malate/lactate/ureidoglycolate dehydrogenase
VTSRPISADLLKTFCRAAFAAHGVPAPDADVCAEVLLAADLRGIDTHGISRLKYYCDRLKSGITRPAAPFEIVRETATRAVADAHLAIGHSAAAKAMQRAIDKAAAHGLGAVAVRNCAHFGIAGYYTLMAAERGFIGIAATNARPAVAPTFSTQPLFGTNPLSIAAPSDEPFAFCYDASLSIVQRGNVEVAARAGRPLREGVAVDPEGAPVTDAALLLRKMSDLSAALLPLGGAGEAMGGHKGYGLAVAVEILCAALQGGDYLGALAGGVEGGAASAYRLGHFFLALNVESFTPLGEFRGTVGGIMRELRAARRAPGADRIWVAGEKEWETLQRRTREGIPVSPELFDELIGLRKELGIPGAVLPDRA